MALSLMSRMCTLLSAYIALFACMCTYYKLMTVLSTGDREDKVFHTILGPPECIFGKHRGNCTGRKDGLYYKTDGGCGVYGCLNETLATLKGNNIEMFEDSLYRSTYGFCTGTTRGINPTTGVCDSQGNCPQDTTGCE